MPGVLCVSWNPRHLIRIWEHFKCMGRSLGKGSKECLAARDFYWAAFSFAFQNCQAGWNCEKKKTPNQNQNRNYLGGLGWENEANMCLLGLDFLKNAGVVYGEKGWCWAGSWSWSIPQQRGLCSEPAPLSGAVGNAAGRAAAALEVQGCKSRLNPLEIE